MKKNEPASFYQAGSQVKFGQEPMTKPNSSIPIASSQANSGPSQGPPLPTSDPYPGHDPASGPGVPPIGRSSTPTGSPPNLWLRCSSAVAVTDVSTLTISVGTGTSHRRSRGSPMAYQMRRGGCRKATPTVDDLT